MLAEISAGLSSLKTAKDIVQGLNSMKTEAAINEVKIELQGLILEAQQGLFAGQEAQSAAADRIGGLEQEIMRLKDWTGEKERYELKALGQGAFAYMLKPGMRGTEPAHWLCTRCFGDGQKSIIQHQGQPKGEPGNAIHACPSCKATFTVHYRNKPTYGTEGEG